MKIKCPCCEGTGKVEEIAAPAILSKRQSQIYQLVKSAKNVGLGGHDIVARLYANSRDGGPLYPLDTVHVTIRNMNMRLASIREGIVADRRGPGSVYRWKNDVV